MSITWFRILHPDIPGKRRLSDKASFVIERSLDITNGYFTKIEHMFHNEITNRELIYHIT